jgi:hypothetical protein
VKPSRSARTLYGPGFTFSIVNPPLESVFTTRSIFSSTLCNVTCTSGKTAPEES